MPKIRAVFSSTGVENNEYGKKGLLYFTDVTQDGKLLTSLYKFNALKSFTSLKPKKGDIFEFEAEVEVEGGLQLKRPKGVVKLDLKHLAEGYEYCINKFLKQNKRLTKEEARNEKVAFIRLTNLFGDDIDFWKYISLPFELNSLYWFLNKDGLELIKEQKKKFNKGLVDVTIEKKGYELGKDKIGEDVVIDSKGQGLMGFMK